MEHTPKTNVSERFVVLPRWLDDFIFKNLGARYAPRQCGDLLVLQWNEREIREYLGTYFPRSFAESYCIFSNFLQQHRQDYAGKSEILAFDFGCGTGGGAIGFIMAVLECLPSIKTIRLEVLDGNGYALQNLEKIVREAERQSRLKIEFRPILMTIDDFYDMGILKDSVKGNYDFLITFKAIYEFVKAQQFEDKNPYEYFIKTFRPKLHASGILCMADLSTLSNVVNDWIPCMMDRAEHTCGIESQYRNEGFNETYRVSHSGKANDRSKITWRIYKTES